MLIGQICNNNPGSTPQLIKNGIIPALFDTVKNHLPENYDAWPSFLFCLNHIMIHEEGRKLALETEVFQAALFQFAENPKFYERQQIEPTHEINTRQQIRSLVDRDPAMKVVFRESLDRLLERGINEGKDIRNKYYSLLREVKGMPQ